MGLVKIVKTLHNRVLVFLEARSCRDFFNACETKIILVGSLWFQQTDPLKAIFHTVYGFILLGLVSLHSKDFMELI